MWVRGNNILCSTVVNSETETHFFSGPVFEQSVGIYEPKAPSFRVFDPRGVTRINFTCSLVKFSV